MLGLILLTGAGNLTADAKGNLTADTKEKVDLSGEWKVTLDGIGQKSAISMPGTTDLAGLGTPADTLAMSTDEKFRRLTRRHSYIGPATYTRDVTISREMADRPLELTLERVIWKSTASIGDLDSPDTLYSLVSPHTHRFPDGLPEGTYPLTVTIDNTKQYDISFDNLAHAYTNDTQVMWNGILGEISLRAIPETDILRHEIYTIAGGDSIRVKTFLANNTSKKLTKGIEWVIDGTPVSAESKIKLMPGENVATVTLPVKQLEKWNEFHPTLYTLTSTIGNASGTGSGKPFLPGGDAEMTSRFGIRTLDNNDGLRVNGVPVFLRGTLECCVFPLTGAPATDTEGWRKTFATAKEWGLNHLRFHSWCPPEAAFEVADSLGFYLQVELPVWSLKIGDNPEAEAFLKEEYEKIIRNYGNHPSLCMLSVGNELQHDFNWLNGFVAEMKRRDPRHLYATTSFTFEKGHGGHPEPEDEFFVTQWTDDGWVRGQGVFESEKPSFNTDYADRLGKVNVPLVSHEIGQYGVYPSMEEIGKYTGTLDPQNFKQIRVDLIAKGLIGESRAMTLASANLAALMYKEEIERALKTKGMSGFQLLGLQDFPGQGTALVGLLDAFWDNKGAVAPEWFRQFCGPVVPLLSYSSAVYTPADTFTAEASVANFSDRPLSADNAAWEMRDIATGRTLASGTLSGGGIAEGTIGNVGQLSAPLTTVTKPSAVEISLRIGDIAANSWRIHVYPEIDLPSGNILLTRSFDEAQKALAEGRKVLLAPSPPDLEGIESKFLPVFWSPVHFPKQAGTMGLMCDPSHPALELFPNEGHTDWQWWTLVKNAKTVNITGLKGVSPIVKAIDNFVHNCRLAYIFETKVGNGELLFCAFDILNPEIADPAVKALRASLVRYMESDRFVPTGSIDADALDSLRRRTETKTTTATSIYE